MEDMEEIRIKTRRSGKEQFDAIRCIASHFSYPDMRNFKADGLIYEVHLISEENGVKTFAVQAEIEAIYKGWEDFEEKPKKWWQFWKR